MERSVRVARFGKDGAFGMFGALAALLAATACSTGGGRGLDAGAGGAGDAGGAGGAGGQGAACVLNAGAADWFAGVWSGVQNAETFTVTNGDGCSVWEGTVGGTLCDLCMGTYTITGATTGMTTLACVPKSSCSASPVHTDTGTLVQSGCTFVYDYQFTGASGSGSATFTGPNRIGDAVANACPTADAGTD
jgi:hypothetical protein